MFLYGVVNASPDSLNADSIVAGPEQALARARRLLADGADGLDLGGQGSTDAATVVAWEAEWERLRDVVPALATLGVPMSVDTWRPEVLRRALQAGATVINAADGMQSDEMWQVATEFDVPIVVPFLSGPNPPVANVPAGTTGAIFSWTVQLDSSGEYRFSAAAEDATGTTSWPGATSASVLSALDGGPNVITWSLGSNVAGIPGELLTSGYTPGVYAFRGGNTKEFSKYGIASNAWLSKAQTTNGIEKGGSLTNDGAGTLYALEGNSKIFYKYDILTNTWSTLANTSDNANEGGAVQYLNGYVYAALGGSNRFRRYNVSTNTWGTLANTPSGIKKGGALTTDGTYLYALQGDRKTGFFRYNVSTNTWSTMAVVPGQVGWGGSLARVGDYIYAMQGDGKTGFYRYSISGNTWTAMAPTLGNVSEGGALTTDGTYVYAFQGKTTAYWRYDIAQNTWTTLAPANNASTTASSSCRSRTRKVRSTVDARSPPSSSRSTRTTTPVAMARVSPLTATACPHTSCVASPKTR